MEAPDPVKSIKEYYNIGGRFSESEKEFIKFIKKEIKFYEKLSKQAAPYAYRKNTEKII